MGSWNHATSGIDLGLLGKTGINAAHKNLTLSG